MKTNIIASLGVSALVVIALALAGFFKIPLVAALEDATTSPPVSIGSTSSPVASSDASTTPDLSASTSTPATEDTASSTPAVPSESTTTVASNPSSASTPAVEPPPAGLTLVHIIGTKYIDYFKDGTTTIAVPGDPNIDSHFAEPNAPAPTHNGMTWVHTTGGYLYDTSSGDLEVGDYALQPDGSYIENAPPFVSSTSTPAELPTVTTKTGTDTSSSTTTAASSSAPDASTSTVAAPSENSTSTTNSDSTTSPTI